MKLFVATLIAVTMTATLASAAPVHGNVLADLASAGIITPHGIFDAR